MSAHATVPYHCPFCGEEDLRPAEQDVSAWVCRSCARIFTVALVRIDHGLVPGRTGPVAGVEPEALGGG